MEHVARVRDVELLAGIIFFPNLYEQDQNPAIRFKLRLPQFTSPWLNHFLEAVPPNSERLGSGATSFMRSGATIFLSLFWALVYLVKY